MYYNKRDLSMSSLFSAIDHRYFGGLFGTDETIFLLTPWDDVPEHWRGRELELKDFIMKNTHNPKTYFVIPPKEYKEELTLEQQTKFAKAAVYVDKKLADLRFKLVPNHVSEKSFWRSYFYIVHLIKTEMQIHLLQRKLDKIIETGEAEEMKRREVLDQNVHTFKNSVAEVSELIDMATEVQTHLQSVKTSGDEKIEQKLNECRELRMKIREQIHSVTNPNKYKKKMRSAKAAYKEAKQKYENLMKLKSKIGKSEQKAKELEFLPKLLNVKREPHTVLSEDQRRAILKNLPLRFKLNNWTLLYKTSEHGISLNTFYRQVEDKGPAILIIQTSTGCIFGAFISESIHIAHKFYGTGETFVFTFRDDKFKVYKWSKQNKFFIRSTQNSVAIGGGITGRAAIYFDAAFLTGSSGECVTFNSKCLNENDKVDFEIYVVEVWGFE